MRRDFEMLSLMKTETKMPMDSTRHLEIKKLRVKVKRLVKETYFQRLKVIGRLTLTHLVTEIQRATRMLRVRGLLTAIN